MGSPCSVGADIFFTRGAVSVMVVAEAELCCNVHLSSFIFLISSGLVGVYLCAFRLVWRQPNGFILAHLAMDMV